MRLKKTRFYTLYLRWRQHPCWCPPRFSHQLIRISIRFQYHFSGRHGFNHMNIQKPQKTNEVIRSQLVILRYLFFNFSSSTPQHSLSNSFFITLTAAIPNRPVENARIKPIIANPFKRSQSILLT